jgi:AraC-like DNA-binding protein
MNNKITVNDNDLFKAYEVDFFSENELFKKSKNGFICYCQRGEIEMLVNLNPVTVGSDSQLILLPNSIVKTKRVSNNILLNIIEINESLFRDVSAHINPLFFRMLRTIPCIKLSPESKKAVNSFILLAKGIYKDTDNLYRQQIIRSALNAYMLYTYDRYQRFYYTDDMNIESTRSKIFDSFVDLLHHNCNTQREVTFYADKLCISTKYLTDICHKVAGVSAKKIIDNFAILQIKILLHNPQLTMQDIAHKMDFPDQSYLGRYFKRFEGISPSSFRKQLNNEMGG